MGKRTDNRVPIGTLKVDDRFKQRPEGITWIVVGTGDRIIAVGNKQYKYITNDTKVFPIEKEDNNG